MKTLLIILSFILLNISTVFAAVSLDGGNFTVSYAEPTANEDNTPLLDLSHTTIYYKLDSGNRIEVMTISASSAIGGGTITRSFNIPGLGSQVDIILIYTATDQTGNESVGYREPGIRRDHIAPGAPTG